MKKRLLLASDFDGTVGVGGQLEKDRAAIARFRAQGHLFGLVSGRNAAGLKEMRKKTDLPCDFLLSDNGSVCYLPKKGEKGQDPFAFEENSAHFDPFCGGKLLFYHAGAEELFFPLADFLLECGSQMVAVNDHNGAELLYLEEDGSLSVNLPRESWIARPFSQMSGLFERTEDAHAAAREGEKRFPGLVGLVSDCLDFLPRGRDKAVGILELAALLGVKEEDIFTVGDNFNDLAMLRAFRGFAVENAPKEVKMQAKEGEIPTLSHLIDLLLSKDCVNEKENRHE
ncbi:MAG: HAD family phosphatase [Clostridia bacterium]|nr:HAD family phosphatase [Clostridia bacterium]